MAYGAAVAAVYALLILLHIVAAIFIALTIVCTLRGLGHYVSALAASRARAREAVREPTVVRVGEL